MKAIGLHRVLFGPVVKLQQQNQTGHGIEFPGRPTQGGIKVLTQDVHRHQFQDDMAERAGPVVLQPLAIRGGQDRRIGGKQAGFSGIYHPLRNGSKSFTDNELQYNPENRLSREKYT
ncbi:MAG: hypothetical protein MUC88_03155 [Planctomycetes bacterium]|nr:hypothetical protein [Planctomycetota bacterium]